MPSTSSLSVSNDQNVGIIDFLASFASFVILDFEDFSNPDSILLFAPNNSKALSHILHIHNRGLCCIPVTKSDHVIIASLQSLPPIRSALSVFGFF